MSRENPAEVCTCDNWQPCACAVMESDPHCMWCCQTLPPDRLKQYQDAIAARPNFHPFFDCNDPLINHEFTVISNF